MLPIFDEMKWVAAYRRGELIPATELVEYPLLMQRMRDFGTPEKVPTSDHWRMGEARTWQT